MKEALETLPPDLDRVDGTSVTLLITATGVHRGKAFSKALLKRAETKVFDQPTLTDKNEDEIIYQIESRMKAAGLRLGPGASERFFQAAAIDTSVWSSEIEKLALYAGDAELTRDDVTRLVGQTAARCSSGISATRSSPARRSPRSSCCMRSSPSRKRRPASSSCSPAKCGWPRLAPCCARIISSGCGPARAHRSPPRARPTCRGRKPARSISTYSLGHAAARAQHRPARFWFAALQRLLHGALRDMVTGRGDKRGLLEIAVLEIVADKSPSYVSKDA